MQKLLIFQKAKTSGNNMGDPWGKYIIYILILRAQTSANNIGGNIYALKGSKKAQQNSCLQDVNKVHINAQDMS